MPAADSFVDGGWDGGGSCCCGVTLIGMKGPGGGAWARWFAWAGGGGEVKNPPQTDDGAVDVELL